MSIHNILLSLASMYVLYSLGKYSGKRWVQKLMWKPHEIELVLDDGSRAKMEYHKYERQHVWSVPKDHFPAALYFVKLEPGLLPFVEVSIPAYGQDKVWYRVSCVYTRELSKTVEGRWDVKITFQLPSLEFDKLLIAVTSCLLEGHYQEHYYVLMPSHHDHADNYVDYSESFGDKSKS